MVYRYPTGGGFVVWSEIPSSLIVYSIIVRIDHGFTYARQTSLCFREGLLLYALTGGSGKIRLNIYPVHAQGEK